MSLQALLELSKKMLEPLTPEQEVRLAEARQRMQEYDKELEQRVRDRIPTREQLNRVIDYGIRHG